jgi:DNA polymerase-1
MLLQVHDELLFEGPVGEVEEMRALVRSQMETVVPLDVALVVDIGVGPNWRDAKH